MQARDLARPLSAQLRQPVIVDNKPGAGQAIGAEAVARASKEGYIIGLIDSGPLTIGPHLRSLSYDPRKSFTPLGGVNKMPLVILSSIGSGITSLAGLRRFAATSERGVSYGSSGLGSIHHLVGELLRSRLEVDLTHVPYRGSSQALTDLVAGRISIMIAALSSGLPMVRAGQAQAIGVTSPKRSEAAPTIPTLAEQGLDDFDAQGWTGLFAPKDIAPSKAAALSAALQRSLADPDFVQQLRGRATPCLPDKRRNYVSFLWKTIRAGAESSLLVGFDWSEGSSADTTRFPTRMQAHICSANTSAWRAYCLSRHLPSRSGARSPTSAHNQDWRARDKISGHAASRRGAQAKACRRNRKSSLPTSCCGEPRL